jgi:GT2 family glycosyltransferase
MPVSDEQFPDAPVRVAVQSVLYQTPFASIVRMLEALDNSARLGRTELLCERLVVVLGDASPVRVIGEDALATLRARFTHLDGIDYSYFGENVGTSRGHNALARRSDTDLIVTSNPDVVPDARALWRMATVFNDPEVGIVEAKQLPVEHPKDYDVDTGFTSWATTAFAMTRRTVFEEVDGFDDQTFFLYCDDVDYSWRVREAGYRVVFLPAAVVFHDKPLDVNGKWMPTRAEHFFSPQAALLLAHKWSRDDVVTRISRQYERSKIPEQAAAVQEFEKRRDNGELVDRHDPDNKIATFVGYRYTEHRFAL